MAKVLTSTGLNKIQNNGSKSDFTHMAVGTGTAVATINDTALVTEVTRIAIGGKTVNGAIITWEGFYTNSQGVGTLTEWGLFDAASGGNLLARGNLDSSIDKTAAIGLILGITMTLTNA